MSSGFVKYWLYSHRVTQITIDMRKVVLFLMGVLSLSIFAQDGSMDGSFGDDGIVITDLNDSHDFGLSVVQQADQKLVVFGTTSPNQNHFYPYLIRYMLDGSVDMTFGTNGKVIADHGSGYNGYDYLFVDNQQNIVAAGNMNLSTEYQFKVAKYTENGDLDTTFGDNDVLTISHGYSAMTLLDDGSMLLLRFSGNNEISINRYLSNGVLDTNFGIDGTAISNFDGDSFAGREMKVDTDNNIYFVGTRDNAMNADIILMKFMSNGYLDISFGNNGIASKNIDAMNPMNSSSASIDFTNDNKIVVAGSCGACVDESQSIRQPYFLKYNSNGLPDINFGDNGTILLPISGFEISKLLLQANQRLVVAGHIQDCFEGSSYIIRRYHADGFQDNSFIGSSVSFEHHKSILQEDGKIVSIGNTHWYDGVEDIVVLRHNNTVLSLPDFALQKAVVYPNPSSGIFIIEHNANFKNEPYQITDSMGRIIAKGALGDTQTQVNLNGVASGVYFMKTFKNSFRLLKN